MSRLSREHQVPTHRFRELHVQSRHPDVGSIEVVDRIHSILGRFVPNISDSLPGNQADICDILTSGGKVLAEIRLVEAPGR